VLTLAAGAIVPRLRALTHRNLPRGPWTEDDFDGFPGGTKDEHNALDTLLGAHCANGRPCTVHAVPLAVAQTNVDADKREYEASCMICHGSKGKGDGPYMTYLDKPPSDIATLARRNNGVFPADRVRRIIDEALGACWRAVLLLAVRTARSGCCAGSSP